MSPIGIIAIECVPGLGTFSFSLRIEKSVDPGWGKAEIPQFSPIVSLSRLVHLNLVAADFSLHHVHHVFGDVGGMVADSFDDPRGAEKVE